MRNAPLTSLFSQDAADSDDDLIPAASVWRIRLIGIGFTIGLVVVFARLAHVQVILPGRYLVALKATTTETEILPSRDGRILSGGLVLAADVEQYAVQLHYRWIQKDADKDWLTRQIRSRLTREERRDIALVERTREQILLERTQTRRQLASLCGMTNEDFEKACEAIETRVQRIADSVNRRHFSPMNRQLNEGSDDTEGNVGWAMHIASAIRNALTTPPRRETRQRIIVREEETWHTIASELPLVIAGQIAEQPERFSGARAVTVTRRTYPEHQLAAHIVGAQTTLSDEELKSLAQKNGIPQTVLAELPEQPRHGRFGVELSYSDRIKGTFGLRQIERNRRQQIVRSEVTRNPVSGLDVVLTIDVSLQRFCEQLLAEALTDRPAQLTAGRENALRDNTDTEESTADDGTRVVPTGGSIVVIDVETGALLAASSGPGFDLQLFTGGSADAWTAANNDQRRPFVSRFSAMALAPGSTFKPLSAIATLETGTFTSRQTFFCQGFLTSPNEHRCLIFRQFGQGHGNVGLTAAMAQSCNVYFFDAAQRMGILPIAEWAERFGFGEKTGIDLPFEKSGTLPVRADTVRLAMAATANGGVGESDDGSAQQMVSQTTLRRFQREALGYAIGQSRLTVTPLQLVRMMAAIANGGWLVTPHVVSEEGFARRADDVSSRRPGFPRMRIESLTPESIEAVHRGLVAVCEETWGTGYKSVHLDHVSIAGKTGTAESAPDKPDHAWFAGYAPADAPRFAFAIVLEHGGSGSHAAGPLAREVVRFLIPEQSSAVGFQ
ncbi:MAG: penicillin-binding transpeptidase domain-containing protein [Planctomycetaceae bacterium]